MKLFAFLIQVLFLSHSSFAQSSETMNSHGVGQHFTAETPTVSEVVQKPAFDSSEEAQQRIQRDYALAFQRAQETGKPPEGMGFYPGDTQSMPEGVRRAADSVFAIAVPAGSLVNYHDIFGGAPYEEVLKRISTTPDGPGLGPADKGLYSYQIRECIRKRAAECMMFEGISYGTAFVTGDGRDLRTALHVVKDFALNARAKGATAHIPVYLLGPDGRVVAGPEKLNAKIAASLAGALDTSIYEGKDLGNSNLDQVLMRVDLLVARPIPIADHRLADGEAAFLVSVPHQTNDRAAFNAPDSDGTTVRISKGTALSPRSLGDRLKKIGFIVNNATTAQIIKNSTAMTADGAPRSSGGAIVNSAGEVVGVFNSSLPQSGVAFPYHISYGGNSLIQVPAKYTSDLSNGY